MILNYNLIYPLYIIGTGPFALEIKNWVSAESAGDVIVTPVNEYFLLPENSQCMIGFLTMEYRNKFLSKALEVTRIWPTFIHPTSYVNSSVSLKDGTIVGPLAAVGYGTVIGRFASIGVLSKIGHRVIIGNNVVFSPGTNVGGSTTIDDNVKFGQACSVKDNITITRNTEFSMNSIVTKHITEPGNYIGNKKNLLAI